MKPRNFTEDFQRRSDADLRKILRALVSEPNIPGPARMRALPVLLEVIRERAKRN